MNAGTQERVGFSRGVWVGFRRRAFGCIVSSDQAIQVRCTNSGFLSLGLASRVVF
jgi:hypothetical protein